MVMMEYTQLVVLLLLSLSAAQNIENRLLNVQGYYTVNKQYDDELCKKQFQSYMGGILNGEDWALNMFDATSKLQSGILSGNLYELGSFKQCLSIEGLAGNATVVGKYCLGTVMQLGLNLGPYENYKLFNDIRRRAKSLLRSGVSLQEIGLQWAGCVPEICSPELAANQTHELFKLLSLDIQVQFTEEMCVSKSEFPSIDGGDIAVMCLFAALICCVITSTAYELYLKAYSKKTIHPVLLAFSAYTNSKKLFCISKSEEQLSCLNGIRVISLMWVILGHSYSVFGSGPVANFLDILEWFNTDYSMYIIGAGLAVDSFFVLSGLLMAYVFLKAMSKGVKFNLFKYYIHRYLRLTPALLGILLIHLTLLKHFGSGPFWKRFLNNDTCRTQWWTNLIYLQNYIERDGLGDASCIGQTWYLAVDMQLFILSPIILLPLWKWPKQTMIALVFLICGSIAVPFTIAWINEYPGTSKWPDQEASNEMIKNIYFKTHCRASAWLIGIGLGYIIYRYKSNKSFLNVNKFLSLLLTGLSLSILCTCVFAGNDMHLREYDRFEHSAYLAFLRPSWALALSWIIFSCISGQGGPINWFLSFPIFQVIGRFTYSMYILHLSMMNAGVYARKIPDYFSDYSIIYKFWGDFMFSFALAYFWILLFESPMIAIEKFLFGDKNSKHDSARSKDMP